MPSDANPPLQWDLFCRVVDNFGDIGVCWRLAADLAARGHALRLWIDDPAALAWLAPGGAAGVEVIHWTTDSALREPGDVVVEAFGCDPPAGFVAAMVRQARPPVWINLEYLSAESYVERSHRLPSPQLSGPGAGLTKWFFYPGFTPATGGLLREPGLSTAQSRFDAIAWMAERGIAPRAGERLISLFCYPNPGLPALLQRLGDAPTLLLTAPGAATEGLAGLAPPTLLRVQALPWLPQADYDRLLWCCALNFVRGEDSFVRAQWAGAPFVWHIYPQQDDAHAAKLEAFLDRHLAGAAPDLAAQIRAWMRAWNGLAGPLPALPELPAWASHVRRWRESLRAQTDLVTQLLAFITEKR
ncbi:MAG TPA: elongation factor P maturation arginine rhamnosyltransferase EarP [Ideonella sp.]|nr:elongation factor P maturation arginine rhamnosyltransferase EarP [Ideonella sp.]